MATQKKAATGKALAKWDAELAALAEQQSKTEASQSSGGNFIKTRGGVFVVDGGAVPGGKIQCVIVDSILENHWFDKDYDPKAAGSVPACYAYGRDDKEMAPHEKAKKPQSEECSECPLNEWGSADTGRGKACSNSRRLALLLASDLEDDIPRAQFRFVNIPPTSAGNYKGYVDQLKQNFGKPTLAVVTEMSITPHPTKQFEINFKLLEEIDSAEAIGDLLAKRKQADKEIMNPYPDLDDEETPSKRTLPARPAAGKAPTKPAAGSKFAKAKR